MKHVLLSVAIAVSFAAAPALAHEKAQGAAAQAAPASDPALKDVIAVAEKFGAALKAADMATVSSLLDERVLILETGGAERSREEYLGHHAIADAAFLGGATITTQRRHGAVHGDTAWLASESEIATGKGTGSKTVSSTETLVLQRTAGTWRIVHIHWSSRPKKAAKS